MGFEFEGSSFEITPGITEYSAPFTMTGSLSWVPDGEHSDEHRFSGSGTAYFTMWFARNRFWEAY